MAYVFELPDIGEGLTEADIVRWHVPVGAQVTMDQVLVEVETAKAVVEIPSPAAGTLLHQGAGEGTTLTVGAVLAVIGELGESWQGRDGSSDGPGTGQGVANSDPGTQQARHRSARGGRRGKALPVVRKLAREHGVDLGSITGTGPGGRITRDDVMAAAARTEPRPEATGDERVRLSMLRRTIAEHMSSSWQEIPHVTIFQDVDATRLLAARRALGGRHERQISMEALVIKALAPVLRRFREFNATLDGDELILHRSLDIGIAVDTADGLLVPIIPNAGEMGLLSLAEAVSDLGTRGKARTLAAHELSGATFTVSNFGALGGGRGTPIIPFGTTAILAVGRAEDAPVVRNGRVSIAPMMPLSLAFDHRVIDGGLGQRFVAMLVENLEEPALFLAD